MKRKNLNPILISLAILLVFVGELSFFDGKISSESQIVQASSLKRAYIPKRFRGTWYANKHDQIKITANSVGGNVMDKTYTDFYHGGYKDVGEGVSRHNLVRYKGKSMIILFEKSGRDTTFRVVNRHQQKALNFQQGGGHIYFYRSRATARHEGLFWIMNIIEHYVNIVIQWIIQHIFSVSALIISLLTLHRNRTTLEVKFSPRIDRTMDLSTEIIDKNGDYIHAYRNVFLVSVEIINSSPNDIAYYDLYAFDPETNNFLEFVNPKAFLFSKPGAGVIHYINKVTFNILNVPLEQYGVFKANSYTRFDLPIIITDPDEIKNIDTLAVGFKTIQRTILKNTNKKS